jgi:hypothetical protein
MDQSSQNWPENMKLLKENREILQDLGLGNEEFMHKWTL